MTANTTQPTPSEVSKESYSPNSESSKDLVREAANIKPHLVIEPSRGFRSLKLKELWEFRDLITTLGMRDVKLIYKQTLLGVAWVVMQPLIGAGIFTFVFGVLADMPSGETPYFVFSLVGMTAWGCFAAVLNASSMVMVNNAHLVSKIYFPRLVLPIASAFQPVVNLGVSSVLMIALLIVYQIGPSWQILLAPLWILAMLMLALGVGFVCCSIMVRYRDLRYIIPVAMQFLLYASPVGYSVAAVDEKVPQALASVYMLNPIASLLEGFRWSVLGTGQVDPIWIGYSLACAFLLFFGGAFLMRRAEKQFADVI
ncbi:MAG: ABC transporter permease [Planctomycetota bacterium]